MSDLIDRQQAIDAVEQWEDNHTWDDWCNEHKDEKERFRIIPPSDYIRSLPSAEPDSNDMSGTRKALDTISRQAAIDAVSEGLKGVFIEHKDIAEKMIGKVPSAQPRMKGKWVKQIDESINVWWYECSVCGDYPLKNAFGHDCLSQFCPWCGAEMSEGEEDD